MESEMDLRRDKVRGVARDAAAAEAVARRKIWYGALQGALEHELAVQEAATGDNDAKTDISSTSGLLDSRGATKFDGGKAPASWETLASSRETAARLASAIAAGETVVVPKAVLGGGGESAWWAISPAGDTRAVWGPDLNGHRVTSSGGYARGAPYGGSSGPSANMVDPRTGNAVSPRRNQSKGANEYTKIIMEVSLPGGSLLRITITPRLLSVVIQVIPLL